MLVEVLVEMLLNCGPDLGRLQDVNGKGMQDHAEGGDRHEDRC